MNVYFTFDYELFVNDNTGDIDNCLIIPTNELMKVFDRQGIRVTFFIDMAYAYRLNELKDKYSTLAIDYDKFCKQVKDIKEHGHEIALHLHPQWFYAKYDGKKWIMDFAHYKLSDMPLDEANGKFDKCFQLLKEISGCNVVTFRAGGFSIQDYKGFYESMRRNQLLKDSSVLFGEKQITDLHSYDYSSLKSLNRYSFSDSIIKPEIDGEFEEFPIATYKMSLVKYMLFKILWRYSNNEAYKKWGNGGDEPERRSNEFKENIKRRLKNGVRVFASVDGHLGLFLPSFYEHFKKNGYDDLIVLGHPKLASKASIANIESFILKYKEKVLFRTIK